VVERIRPRSWSVPPARGDHCEPSPRFASGGFAGALSPRAAGCGSSGRQHRRHLHLLAAPRARTRTGRGRARPAVSDRGTRRASGRARRRDSRAGATQIAWSACSSVSRWSSRQWSRTAATTPAHGSSSSTGASEPFARSAPESSSERNEYVPSRRSAQKRFASCSSEGACVNWTETVIPSSEKRAMSSGARHGACSIRWRRPRGCHTSRERSKASSARGWRHRRSCRRPAYPASARYGDLLGSSLVVIDAAAITIHAVTSERPIHDVFH
jgi:hypothetical protein